MKNISRRGPEKAKWKPIDWRNAINEIAKKLEEIREKKTKQKGTRNILFQEVV